MSTVSRLKGWVRRWARITLLGPEYRRDYGPVSLNEARRLGRAEIGRKMYGNPEVFFYAGDESRVVIGAYTSIGFGVRLITGGVHRADWVTMFPLGPDPRANLVARGDLHIGNDVWLGVGAVVLPGVTVGDGCVVGASSVVSRDLPPYSIAVGSPARVVRSRFSDQDVAELLRVRWWDWPEERVSAAVPYLQSGDVRTFLEHLGR